MKPLDGTGLHFAIVVAVAERLGTEPEHVQGLVTRYHIFIAPSEIPEGGLKAAVSEE